MAPHTATRLDAGADPISRFVTAAVDRAIRTMPVLEPLRGMAETVARFAGVGGASSLLYAFVVAGAVSGLGLNHNLAALLGFAITAPINFVMHRRFTFRSVGLVENDLVRYVIMQAVNVLLSIGAMVLSVDGFHLPYAVGILGAIVLIPLVSYCVMDRWVFRQKVV